MRPVIFPIISHTLIISLFLISLISCSSDNVLPEGQLLLFPDPKLAYAIAEYFEGKVDEITPEDLASVTELDLSRRNISLLNGLEVMTGLEALNLHGNDVTDLSPLKSLNKLRILDLESNSFLRNLEPISGLNNLSELYLGGNRYIEDLSPLIGLTNLKIPAHRTSPHYRASSISKFSISRVLISWISARLQD